MNLRGIGDTTLALLVPLLSIAAVHGELLRNAVEGAATAKGADWPRWVAHGAATHGGMGLAASGSNTEQRYFVATGEPGPGTGRTLLEAAPRERGAASLLWQTLWAAVTWPSGAAEKNVTRQGTNSTSVSKNVTEQGTNSTSVSKNVTKQGGSNGEPGTASGSSTKPGAPVAAAEGGSLAEGKGARMEDSGVAHMPAWKGESEEDGVLREAVRRVCERVATPDRQVIMTTTTYSAIHMLDNMMTSFALLSLDKHCIIFTYEQEGFDYVNTKWPGQAVMGHISVLMKELRGSLEGVSVVDRFSETFCVVVRSRPPLMSLIAHLNYSLLCTDTDIVYVRNPLSMVTNPRFSIYFSLGRFVGTEAMEDVIPIVTNVTEHPALLCSGMVFLRSGDASRKLLRMWADAMIDDKHGKGKPGKPRWHDQDYIRDIVGGLMKDAKPDKDPMDGATLPYCIAAYPLRFVSNGHYLWNVVRGQHGVVRDMLKQQLGILGAMHYSWFFGQAAKQLTMLDTHTWVASISAPPRTLVTTEINLNQNGSLSSMNASALLEHVVPQAQNSTLLFTIAHRDNIKGALAFLRRLQKAEALSHAVVFVLDDFTFQLVNEQHPGRTFLLFAPALSPIQSYPSPLSRRVDLLPFLIKTLLSFNLSLCYCDLETVWFRWPFPVNSTFDILIRYLGNLPAPEALKKDEAVVSLEEHQVREAQSSWLYLKPTPASTDFAERWSVLAQSKPDQHDQMRPTSFRLALLHTVEARIGTLSPFLFPPPKLASWKRSSLALLKRTACVADGPLLRVRWLKKFLP